MKVIRAEWMNSTITPGVEINSIQMLRNAIPQLNNDWSDDDGHIFGIHDW